MTATNHAIAGAIVAAWVKQPIIALPLALLSHYMLDMIPHFKVEGGRSHKRLFWAVSLADAVVTVALLIILPHFLGSVVSPALVATCMLVAIAPDLPWIYRLYNEMKSGQETPGNWHSRFHVWIQWKESHKAAAIEACWLVLAVFVLIKIQ